MTAQPTPDKEATQAVLAGTAAITPELQMTAQEMLAQLNTYHTNANMSLGKIQENIDKVTEQLNNLNRMRLMVLGQREVVNDLIGKATGTQVANKEVSNG